ncbi:transcription activator acu-15 [Apiospora arundinis]
MSGKRTWALDESQAHESLTSRARAATAPGPAPNGVVPIRPATAVHHDGDTLPTGHHHHQHNTMPPPPRPQSPQYSPPLPAPLSRSGSGSAYGGSRISSTTKEFFEHTNAPRVNTDAFISRSLKENYPSLELVVTPAYNCNLLAYARAGHASFEPVENDGKGEKNLPSSLQWDIYVPPARRLDGALGGLGEQTTFGKYLFKWQGHDFLVYLVDGRDGTQGYPGVLNYYVLTPEREQARQLLLAAGRWGADLHEEIWVYDQGTWRKNQELYASIQKASWDQVILDADMKQSLIDDHISFFESRDTYAKLKVPWKRGIIYHGPPRQRQDHIPVPTLYVRSLASYGGPEYSIKQIFGKAREFAPCYLVFEDLDSLIDDSVRSYFLNEVDGLKNNDGIFMVGSTNHLDRLDPGISKRPSRFDRKYYFPDPDLAQRVAYCRFWQGKLADNDEIEFPDELCTAIAEITDKFSFAYMQEAFVAALLAIAQKNKKDKGKNKPRRLRSSSWSSVGGDGEGYFKSRELSDGWVGVVGGGEDFEDLVLWVEIKKQIKVLREGISDSDSDDDDKEKDSNKQHGNARRAPPPVPPKRPAFRPNGSFVLRRSKTDGPPPA